jgi:hypothetical protein
MTDHIDRFVVKSKQQRAEPNMPPKRVFFVRDNARNKQFVPGIDCAFSSYEEASYVAWALNINTKKNRFPDER